jgi:hypothetical protein
MGVVDTETPVTQLPEQVLLLWVVGVRLVALEAVGEGGGLTALALTQYKTLVILHIVVVVAFILWSFTGNETGKGTGGRGSGAMLVEMGNKVGLNSSMGKTTLSIKKLTLKLLLVAFKGYLLPLAALHLVNIRAVPMDVSNDARVLEIGKGIVDEGAGSVRGMKNVVVCIFRTRAIEIGGWERTRIERERVNDTAFLASPHKSGLISYWLVGNILGGLGLAKLVDEDEWVMSKVSHVKLLPALARVVNVSEEGEGMVTHTGNRNGTGGKAVMDDGGRGMSRWLFFVHVIKKDVSEGGDVEEVEDIVVLLDVNVEGLILESLVSEYCDDREKTVHPSIKSLGQK